MEEQERLVRVLADRYRVEREVGRGGMATVYLAEDLKHRRKVAVKVLNPELAETLGTERFLREIETAAHLTHPHILPVFDSGDAGGFLFYVMPYVEGESLRTRLTKEKQLSVEDAIQITREIADALAYAHEKGVIHRDVKPANILIESGHAVLADFGIARALSAAKDDRITRTGMFLGTPAYMSPEQATGEKDLDGRSDQYALACVLFEMLAGEPPFGGASLRAILAKQAVELPPSVRVFRDTVPTSVDAALRRSLSKDRAHRFEDVRGFADGLTGDRKQESPRPLSALKPTLVALALSLAVIALWVVWSRPAVAFSQGDPILIADFENLTGDEVFDRSLNMALEISLGQSSYLNVYPRARVEKTLRRMELPETLSLSPDVAREVAEREGIGVVVLPRIASLGGVLSLSLRVQDPSTGRDFETTQVSARDQSETLEAVDALAEWLRSYLGENLSSLSVQQKPLADVTTSSLEALKHYSLGLQEHWRGDFEGARHEYRYAISIDSTFTAALGSLGNLELERFDASEGVALLERAVANSDRVTEKERLGILGFYASAVKRDLDEAIRYMEAGVELYPDHLAFRNNLGYYHRLRRSYERALEQYKIALSIDPEANLTYNGVNQIYLYHYLDLDSARVWIDRQIALAPESPWAFDHLGWLHLARDSLEEAVVAFERSLTVDPTHESSLYRLAHTFRLLGRNQEALRPLREILALDSVQPMPLYQMGVIRQRMGDLRAARLDFEEYLHRREEDLETDPTEFYYNLEAALACARLGEEERSRTYVRIAMDIDSTSAGAQFDLGRWHAVLGETARALDHLEQAVEFGNRNFIWMKIHPDLIALYDEPRFQALIRRGLYGEN